MILFIKNVYENCTMIMILILSSMNSLHVGIYTKRYVILLLFSIDTKVYLKLTRHQQTFEWQAFVNDDDDDDAKYCIVAFSS